MYSRRPEPVKSHICQNDVNPKYLAFRLDLLFFGRSSIWMRNKALALSLIVLRIAHLCRSKRYRKGLAASFDRKYRHGSRRCCD